MSATNPIPPTWVTAALHEGIVIPAHPLALTPTGGLDERHQRALARYYHASGAGGLAVAVHTTQFEIRDKGIGLLEPVLALAAETLRAADNSVGTRTVRLAGVCGDTRQAMSEARLAADLGYHAGLLSLAALPDASLDELVAHCEEVASVIPLIGFYLQPAVGGRYLPVEFWRQFAEIPNVIAIKVAPFNRYQTFDVVRAVAESSRADEIALYTGNDDHILLDLITHYEIEIGDDTKRLGFSGGLLGHWACWTRRAVEHLALAKDLRGGPSIPAAALTLAEQITDANAVLFDAANAFAGCIAGIHEVLYRQGLMANTRCLNPNERLSPGQSAELERIVNSYPHLTDDEFVAEHLDEWLR